MPYRSPLVTEIKTSSGYRHEHELAPIAGTLITLQCPLNGEVSGSAEIVYDSTESYPIPRPNHVEPLYNVGIATNGKIWWLTEAGIEKLLAEKQS